MNRLMAWLKAHVPVADETTIAHGDDRLGNLIIHPDGPQGIGGLGRAGAASLFR